MLSLRSQDPIRLALESKRIFGGAGGTSIRWRVDGDGWSAMDIVCSSGPDDRPFEERRSGFSVSLVVAGLFAYRCALGRTLMIPGAMLLGNDDGWFECDHEHGEGDRCFSFHYDPALVAEAAADDGWGGFTQSSVPPARGLSPLFARAASVLRGTKCIVEELALDTLAIALLASHDRAGVPTSHARFNDERRVSEVARYIEHHHDMPVSLAELAERVGLSRFHFLRLFKQLTGTTPHQFAMRMRLRTAATRLGETAEPVTAIAYAAGFQDLSNFIRSFGAEFGMSPSRFRARERCHRASIGGADCTDLKQT